jgi:hypothetical protein
MSPKIASEVGPVDGNRIKRVLKRKLKSENNNNDQSDDDNGEVVVRNGTGIATHGRDGRCEYRTFLQWVGRYNLVTSAH